MMVAVRAMYVSMREFLGGRFAHRFDRTMKAQRFAGKRVVAVDYDFVLGDIGYGIDERFLSTLGFALEAHSDLDLSRKFGPRFDTHQLCIILAEGIGRLQMNIA